VELGAGVVGEEEELPLGPDTMMPPPLETQYTFWVGAEPGCATRTRARVTRISRARVALCLTATLCAKDKIELRATVGDGKRKKAKESTRMRKVDECIVYEQRREKEETAGPVNDTRGEGSSKNGQENREQEKRAYLGNTRQTSCLR